MITVKRANKPAELAAQPKESDSGEPAEPAANPAAAAELHFDKIDTANDLADES